MKEFPNIKLVATTLREVHSTNRHDWAAVLWLDGKRYVSPTCQLDVIDRIGGGDGFAAGLIYGLLAGRAAGGGAAARLGARGAADDLPRRRDDGAARRGRGVRQGRLGPGAAVETNPERQRGGSCGKEGVLGHPRASRRAICPLAALGVRRRIFVGLRAAISIARSGAAISPAPDTRRPRA